jgi:hypothetical protein
MMRKCCGTGETVVNLAKQTPDNLHRRLARRNEDRLGFKGCARCCTLDVKGITIFNT